MSYRGHRFLGLLLIVFGVIGVVGGIVPFVFNGLRMLTRPEVTNAGGLAAHGVEAMGLSLEWALLSSAVGTFLGGLLIWSGAGWMKERDWARLATWVYVAGGLTVNVTDMIIFAFWARPGAMRTQMLVFDGIALLIPVVLAFWLLTHPPPPVAQSHGHGRGPGRRPALLPSLPPLPPNVEDPGEGT